MYKFMKASEIISQRNELNHIMIHMDHMSSWKRTEKAIDEMQYGRRESFKDDY